MQDLFEIITIPNKERENEKTYQLGLRLRIGSQETLFPISKICRNVAAMESEILRFQGILGDLLGQFKSRLEQGAVDSGTAELPPEMPAEQVWSVLSEISEESLFIESFNGLDEMKRREVAEYVLTQCNIFSGKAAFFSERYEAGTGILQ